MAKRETELIAHTFRPLTVKQTKADIVVTGTTFAFAFSRANGLIRSLRILDQEWLAKRPVPDLWASPEVDPRGQHWEAARETEAQVRVVKAGAERVVLEATGRYLSAKGEALPLRYRLTYAVDCDGVVQVDVTNQGTGRGAVRWLVFSSAAVKRDRVSFYSHIGDLSKAEDTGGWVTEEMPVGKESQELIGMRFLPWMQLGNDRSGLDLVMDDAAEISHGWTDSEPLDDPLKGAGKTFTLDAASGAVAWTYYAIRNLHTPLRRDWRRANRFYLCVAPAKAPRADLAEVRVHWLGPHQFRPGLTYPSDEDIASLARRGINVVIGGVNWRSGEYAKPENARETRRLIAACHRHGMRIIPYITFTDLEHDTVAFPPHGQEWQIEPVAEFKHATNLMCYGAEGWREYWRKDVDTILDRFDFDGLYIDFWVGKMGCRNLLHGCGHKYPRFTLPGIREMAWHAFTGVRRKGADQFILCNTNLFAGAMINNLVDLRLPGEWANIEETPPVLARGHLNSHRLGGQALLLRKEQAASSLRSVSFSLRCQSPMVMSYGWHQAIAEMPPLGVEPDTLLARYADFLRCFGATEGEDAWVPDGSLEWTGAEGTAYWLRSAGGTLLVVPNLNPKPVEGTLRIRKPARVGLSPRTRYLAYRPDLRGLVADIPLPGNELHEFTFALKPYEPALLFLTPSDGAPRPLWASLSDGFREMKQAGRALTFTVAGADGGRSRVVVYAGDATVDACRQAGKALRVKREGPLAILEAACNAPIEMQLAP